MNSPITLPTTQPTTRATSTYTGPTKAPIQARSFTSPRPMASRFLSAEAIQRMARRTPAPTAAPASATSQASSAGLTPASMGLGRSGKAIQGAAAKAATKPGLEILSGMILWSASMNVTATSAARWMATSRAVTGWSCQASQAARNRAPVSSSTKG